MKKKRLLIRLAGSIALLIGMVWIGQGTGAFPYPPQSFMIGVTLWSDIGAILAAFGLVAIVLAGQL